MISSKVLADIQHLTPGYVDPYIIDGNTVVPPTGIVELYDLDLTRIGGSIYRFHAGTNEFRLNIHWQSNIYFAIPVEASGFEVSGQGTLPRPTLRVANISGLMSAAVREMDDLVGAKLTRRRTFIKYLDADNFVHGNSTADPTAEFPLDIYYIDRKVTENKVFIEFELVSALELQGVILPRRQFIQNVCTWEYRSAECGYAGGPVATDTDIPTALPSLDVCGKRLTSCKLRFGENSNLPYGGFPGTNVKTT